MKYLSIDDLDDLALGASVLGAGGGGDPYLGKLMAKEAISQKGEVPILDPDDVPDNELFISSCVMGATSVMLEKISNGMEPEIAFRSIENLCKKKASGVIALEMGGINSCVPIYTAAQLGIPIVDADGMGRAFPELHQTTFGIQGVSASPLVCCDEKGNKAVLHTIDNKWVETISRSATVAMGLTSVVGLYPMNGITLKKTAIPRTLSLAIKIGKGIREAQKNNSSPIQSILEATLGYKLFEGKLVDIVRDLTTGFVRGTSQFEGIDSDKGSTFRLDFQNENLIGFLNGKPCAMAPDLITVLDKESGTPLLTEQQKYGQRVVIICMPCGELWRTKEGLAVAGPRYFNYDLDFIPIEELVKRGVV